MSTKEKFMSCIELWRELIETAYQNEDFTDKGIDQFDNLCDTF